MGKVNYAAIDIGSNAVRLLIKSIDREAVQEKKIKKVMMLRVPLRLGKHSASCVFLSKL